MSELEQSLKDCQDAAMRHGNAKEEFETGATRDVDTGKGRPSLISPVLIHRTAKHLAAAEPHHGKDNWTKGMPFCRTADSLIRHINLWLAGDEEEDHLAALACNTMFLMHFEESIKTGALPASLDDRCEAFKKILPSLLTPPIADATVEKPEEAAPLYQDPWQACGACGARVPQGTTRCLDCERTGRII